MINYYQANAGFVGQPGRFADLELLLKNFMLKAHFQFLISVFCSALVCNNMFAQAPSISYSTPTNIYTVGTAITPLSPTNSGGAVPATTYAQVTTLVASGAGLANPQAVATDNSGNIYVADYGNNLIRKVTSAGVMTTLAGSGAAAEFDGTGTAAKFNGPDGIAFDGSANLYVSDAGGNKIRKIVIATGVVTTFAGTGTAGHANNATPLLSTFNGPAGLSIDASGNMFIADQGNNLIREISGTTVSTLAGGGSVGGVASGSANGMGTSATFNTPNDLVADGSGNIFVADYGNNLIRKIVVSTGLVTTYAGSGAAAYLDGTGTSAKFNRLSSLTMDASGNLVVADLSNFRIRLVTTGTEVTTVAGTGTAAETDGTGTAAAFNSSGGIETDNQGNCYIVDFPTSTTGTVRKMTLTGYTISPALPAGLSFASTTGVISGTPTATSASTNYTITAYNASGSSSSVISIACGTSVAWLGFSSKAWATGSNWSTGAAPGINDAVSIGVSAYTGSKKEPVITTAVTVGSITFGNNARSHTLTVTSPGALTIGSYLTVPTAVTPTITGTGSINISPGAIININGTGVLHTTLTGKLTLKSDATGSASVGQILSTSITGSGASSIYVERYITGGAGYRGYRLLSSPVYNATVSSNNVYSINYLQNSIYLTGAVGGGFDKTGNPTLYLFREDQNTSNATATSGNFWGISAINNTLNYNYYMNGGATNYNIPAGNGLMFFFRGNRASATVAVETQPSYTVPVSVTLTTSGTLNTGQVVVHDWYTPASANLGWTNATANTAVRGFNLVGNPYASSIDWEQYNTSSTTTGIYANNVSNSIYELNPVTNNYDTYQVGGAATNQGSNIIASGQAFFVVATNNSSPQLIFNESAKSTSQNTGLDLFMLTSGKTTSTYNAGNDQHLRLQIAADSINTDDSFIGFNAAANPKYNHTEDAPYKPGTGKVSLASFSSDNVLLAINKQPLPKLKQAVIPLRVGANAYGTYRLNLIELKSIPRLFELWLMDNFTRDSINLRQDTSYSFNMVTDTNSYGNNRFKLVIRQDPALKVHLLNFIAAKVKWGAQVKWTTTNEENYTNFTVERSSDGGTTYQAIGGFYSTGAGKYSFLDKAPPAAPDMYRLKIEDINGIVSRSKVVTLVYTLPGAVAKNSINIYPNPAGNIVNLTITPASQGSSGFAQKTVSIINPTARPLQPVYSIKIANNLGSIVKTATTAQSDWQTDVGDLLPGTYVIQVVNNADHSVVGKATFIKL